MRLGRLGVRLVSDGEFRLDGGAMFGVVPKSLWSRVKGCDDGNRIRMATHSLLVESGNELVLIDAGLGDKNDAKFQQMYGYEANAVRLPEAIRRAGYEPGDVTHVLLTHLHFDHCGWCTREQGGRLVPTFPRARYWICRGELEHAREPNERDRTAYQANNWEPLFAAGVVELFEDGGEPVAGVRAVRAPGHTRDMCVVELEGGDDARAVFLADLVPLAVHVPYPWIMAYDLYPLDTLASKQRWLPRIAAERRLCVFQHDVDVPLGRLVADAAGRLRAEPVAS